MTLPKNYLRLVGGLLLVLIGGVFLILLLIVLWLFLHQIINNSRTHIFSFSLGAFFYAIYCLCLGVAGFVFAGEGISLIRSAWFGEPVKLIKRVKRGLHLTEFAIAMGIVGTLAAIIIPSYCDYTEVMQVISGLNMSDEIRVGVEKFW